MVIRPITLLVPVKNGGIYLPSAIRNFENSVGPNDEILIINDSSTDQTERILNKWMSVNPQVRVLNNIGVGLVSALNFGLKEASNDWVARADVDDYYEAGRLDFQRSEIDQGTVAIFSDYQIFHSNNKSLGIIHTAVFPTPVSISLVTSQRTPHSSVLYNRLAINEAGGYRAEDFPAEDLSLWLRLSRNGILKSIPKPLLHYRVSNSSITATNNKLMQSRKRLIFESIGLNQPSVQDFMQKKLFYFNSYDLLENSSERRILLYRDFKILQKHLGISEKTGEFDRYFYKWISLQHDARLAASILAASRFQRKLFKYFNSPRNSGL